MEVYFLPQPQLDFAELELELALEDVSLELEDFSSEELADFIIFVLQDILFLLKN